MARGKHPDWQVLKVEFETYVQDVDQRFSLPQDIADLLKVKPLDWVRVSVDGTVRIAEETMQLVSGLEICDERLQRSERIRVQVSLPKTQVKPV